MSTLQFPENWPESSLNPRETSCRIVGIRIGDSNVTRWCETHHRPEVQCVAVKAYSVRKPR